MLRPGQPAPDFSLPNHAGELVESRQLRGQPLLIWFYPRADTPG